MAALPILLYCFFSLFQVSWSVKAFEKYCGMQCTGSEDDIVRDFVGDAEECKAKCIELDGCVGFVRVNSGSQYAGKCYFRGGIISDPVQYNGDDRDCYTVERFKKFDGQQCVGTDADILRDFQGNARQCAQKCVELEPCVGFIRVNSGSQYAGKCYFRAGILNAPYEYNGDDRDCFQPVGDGSGKVQFAKNRGDQCTGSVADILRDFEGTQPECKRKCRDLEGCVGFIRVNSGSQYAGKCYFRGGVLSDPVPYNNDKRDCFEPVFFRKYGGAQCTGSDDDILRDFVGTVKQCERKCSNLDGCIGFVRVDSGSQYAGKCYFRGGDSLSNPQPYNGDVRDCYETVKFDKYAGSQCTGTGADILRDFRGTALECQEKCANLAGCVGFVRVNSGSQYAGKCYFRSGSLNDPYAYNGDDRDCYELVGAAVAASTNPWMDAPEDIYNAPKDVYNAPNNDYIYFVVSQNTVMVVVAILVLLVVINVVFFWSMNRKKQMPYKVVKYSNTDTDY